MIEPGPYAPIDKEQSAKPGPWIYFSFVLLSTSRASVGVEFCIRKAHGRVSPLRLVGTEKSWIHCNMTAIALITSPLLLF